MIGEGHATFLPGLIGGSSGAVGGAWRRSAGFGSREGPVVLGQILGVPVQQLVRNVLWYFMEGLARFIDDFIQLLHGSCVPVQEVKPGINMGSWVV
jgi:hypothetical protein